MLKWRVVWDAGVSDTALVGEQEGLLERAEQLSTLATILSSVIEDRRGRMRSHEPRRHGSRAASKRRSRRPTVPTSSPGSWTAGIWPGSATGAGARASIS